MPNFRAYPTVADTPNRKQRKAQRKRVFAENQDAYGVARRARRDARRKEKTNG
jgi:hypothetical protein